MRKTDTIFLICVGICTTLFAVRSISQSVRLLPGAGPSAAAVSGSAGQPRDVDMTKLQRLLDQRVLSNREAEFYEPYDESTQFGVKREEVGKAPVAPKEEAGDGQVP